MRTRIASAGTGKTTYLIGRIVGHVTSGTPLRRVAAVTYTRRAANDLKTKLRAALEQLRAQGEWLDTRLAPAHRPAVEGALRELDGANIGTIHAFLANLLRLVAPTITLDPGFEVIGEHDAKLILREEAATYAYLTGTPIPDRTMARLEELFAKRSLATSFASDHDTDRQLLELYEALMTRYRARLDNRALAPADLELTAAEAARRDVVLERWRERVTHVIVDEAQDLNPVQGEFLERLERSGIDIEAVGDPKQSIYAFRHADLDTFRRITTGSERGEPLTTTYRHSRVITRFLNDLTANMTRGEAARGFNRDEAPPVTHKHDAPLGSLRAYWVQGDRYDKIDDLRTQEADVLARALKLLHEREGVPFDDMAVLVRSRASQPFLEAAFAHHDVPLVIVQGRNYYKQPEVRDLAHALKLIKGVNRLSLAAWLHSPYAQLDTAQLHATLTAQDPIAHLENHHPRVHERLRKLQAMRNLAPIEALTRLARDPLIDGRAYTELLDAAQADNVDNMLVLTAPAAGGSIDALIHALDELAEQEEVGAVPQSGAGVKLTTIHMSKGLEWPVVAVFDLGRGDQPRSYDVLVEPGTGRVATSDNPELHQELHDEHRERERQEAYRLLYVALSRAKDHMILTGSVKENDLTPATRELAALDLGPGESTRSADGNVLVHTVQYQRRPSAAPTAPATPEALPVEAWSAERYPHPEEPLILRPSHARPHEHAAVDAEARHQDAEGDAPRAADAEDPDGNMPAIIGTLVHYGIAKGWRPGHQASRAALESQVILAALDDHAKTSVIHEVERLLAAYHAMRGNDLPIHVTEEHRELPFIHTTADDRIWSGVIDHLYRLENGEWVLDDYKTDAKIDPKRYETQMRLYGDAARAWTGETPTLRLVYLRHQTVITLSAREATNA